MSSVSKNKISILGSIYILLALVVVSVTIFGFTWLFLMHTETVEPGEELVIVDRPYIFDSFGEGVRKDPIKEGRVLLFLSSKAYPVSVVPTSVNVPLDDFSTRDLFLLDFESNIQLKVVDSVRLIDKFGPDWFKNNIQFQYLGIVRTVLKKHDMRNIVSDTITAESVDQEITDLVNGLVTENNIPVKVLNITLGRAKPNNEVINQLNATAAQKERQNTLIAQEIAEKQRATTERERANADNAYRNSIGFNVEQFVNLQIADKYSEACKTSNSCIIINGPSDKISIPVK